MWLLSVITWDELEDRTKESICTKYHTMFAPTEVQPVWKPTSNPAKCDLGSVRESAYKMAKNRINFYREMTGLLPEEENESFRAEMQAATQIMSELNKLGHDLSSYKDTSKCYTDNGNKILGKSNLGYAKASWLASNSLTTAVQNWIDDAGTPNLGHRRWILCPVTKEYAIGLIGNYSSMKVIDMAEHTDASVLTQKWVSWPPPGFIPKALIYKYWHISHFLQNWASLEDNDVVTVSVTDEDTGVELIEDGKLNTDVAASPNAGCSSAAIQWQIPVANVKADASYLVKFKLIRDGEDFIDIEYRVKPVDCAGIGVPESQPDEHGGGYVNFGPHKNDSMKTSTIVLIVISIVAVAAILTGLIIFLYRKQYGQNADVDDEHANV